MHPLSDKDLDRISREAAEQYDVEPSTAGWDKLEQRLDKVMPQQKEKDRRRLLWWFMLPLLLMGGGLWWLLNPTDTMLQGKPASEQVAQAASVAEDIDKKDKKENAKPSTEINSIPATSKEKEISTNSQPDNTEEAAATPGEVNKIHIKVDMSKKKPGPNSAKSIALTNSKQNKPGDGKISEAEVTKSNEKQSQVIPPADDQKKLVESDQKLPPGTTVAAPSAVIDDKASAEKAKNDKISNAPSAAANNKTDNKSDKPKQKTQGSKKIQPLELGVIAGIDYSTIHSTNTDKLGYLAGLQFGYRFARHWQVNTGFIYTKKYYEAKGEDFHPPKHYWTNYVDLNSVGGYCEMWDIPLNIRYYINPGKSWEWFASAGASSYIMRKQQYDYSYYYNNQPSQRTWKTTSQTNQWFSVLNLSAGFEKSISKTFSLQAEPFAKIALQGIGFGNMDMNSFGLMVGLKYKPLLLKKSK